MEPNADAGSRQILGALDDGALPDGSRRCTHLARPLFCAALRHCAVLVGNSSSGIIEAASFGTPVVNAGSRQHLREHGPNVVDVPVDAPAIEQAVRSQLVHGRWPWDNPWGDGQAAGRIARLLSTIALDATVLGKTNSY